MTAWIDGPGSLLRRPDAISSDFLFSFSVGPDELADPSKGLLHRVWMVDTHGGKAVTLYKSSVTLQEQFAGKRGEFGEPVELFSYTGSPIMEVDLGFDQNGNVVVCAERDGMIWLYWFDPREGKYVFHSLGPGRTPRILLDDPETTVDSDLLLFYATPDGTAIEMRQQRELYDVVHQTPASGEGLRCEEVAKASDYRLHIYYSRHNTTAGRYELMRMESAPYPVRLVDGASTALSSIECETKTVLFIHEGIEGITPSFDAAQFDLLPLIAIIDPEGSGGPSGGIISVGSTIALLSEFVATVSPLTVTSNLATNAASVAFGSLSASVTLSTFVSFLSDEAATASIGSFTLSVQPV